uniref:Putative peptidase n=1 Tax=viral metagenome TaxID=1070528 RepID=A0A6M3JEP6_9ZZZZ
MDALFLVQLEKAREIAGVPFIVTSGYRCEKHNAEVGSTSNNHTSGKAADIKADDGPTRGKILKGLYLAGFRRIGISFKGNFIHADSMDKIESCWSY